MTPAVTLLTLYFLGAALVIPAAKLPSYIQPCKRSDPEFDKCLLKSIQIARPHLAKGIPKMKVPPLEPLVIPALEINRNTEALQVKAKLKDIKAFGGSSFVVNKIKTDLDNLAMDLTITLPRITVSSEYDVDGRMLVIPLKGKGIFHGNFTNIQAEVKGTGKLIKNKKGVEFLQVKSVKVRPTIGDQEVRFINKGDRNTEAITQTAMNFYNQNRQQVLEVIMPIVTETVEAFIVQFANPILRSVPFSEVLPD